MRIYSLNYLALAMGLRNVTPAERLVALYLADRANGVDDDGSREWDDESEPERFAPLSSIAEWCGCPENDVVNALAGLSRHVFSGVRITAGVVFFRWVDMPPRATPPGSAPQQERQISIYVISAGQSASKIGISVDPENRLLGLQGANPLTRMTLEFHAQGGSSVVRKIEKAAHERLVAHLIGNEWFSVTADEAIGVVRALLSEHGIR